MVTGGYEWLWVVTGGYGVVTEDYGWLRVGYGVVMGGQGWLWVVMGG